MCLPRIGEIVAIDGDEAVITTPLTRDARISLLCVPDAAVGDHVMVHAGYAIELLDPIEAVARQDLIDSATGRSSALPPPEDGAGER